MPSPERLLDLTLPEVAAARMLGLAAVLRDLETAETAISGLKEQLAEVRHSPANRAQGTDHAVDPDVLAEELAVLCRDWTTRSSYAAQQAEGLADCHDFFDSIPELKRISPTDLSSSLDVLDNALARLGGGANGERATWVILESLASTALPEKMGWVASKPDALRPSVVRYQPGLGDDGAAVLIERLATLHKRAKKRITKDAMPPGMQATIGAVSVGIALVVPGSDVVGSFVGEQVLHLHGAAAHSAGLALLGGGSLASGGFGMAGGVIVAGSVAKGIEVSARKVALARMVARVSSEAFISELAAMDVRCTMQPDLQHEVTMRLRDIHDAVRADWDANRPNPAERRRRIWGHLQSLADEPGAYRSVAKGIRAELPPEEERNLATSARALQYEIRHLESPDWKRRASALPRFFSVPIAARLIDQAESLFDENRPQNALDTSEGAIGRA